MNTADGPSKLGSSMGDWQVRGIPPITIWFVVFAALGLVWGGANSDWFRRLPGAAPDEVPYENLAFHLNQGSGFELDFDAPDWIQPYRSANLKPQTPTEIETFHVHGSTSIYPPAFPLLMSTTYRIAGRQWWLIRVLNALMLATGVSFLLRFAVRQFRTHWIAWIATLTIILDYGILQTVSQILPQSLAILLLSLLLVTVSLAHETGKLVYWALAGWWFGWYLLTCVNSHFWLLMILGLLPIVFVSWWISARSPWMFGAGALSFLLVVFCLGAPWWVRNCSLTGEWEPFGCAGNIGWTGGYCDQAYENWGNQYLPNVANLAPTIMRSKGAQNWTLAEQEHAMGEVSKRRAHLWITGNLGRLPKLMGMKIASHFGVVHSIHWSIGLAQGMLLVSAVIGCFSAKRPLGFWIGMILIMSAVTTGVTWSDNGRESIPIRPMMHLASALTTYRVCRWLLLSSPFGERSTKTGLTSDLS